jgi:hypothetical protein
MFKLGCSVMIIGQLIMVIFAPTGKDMILAGLFAVANYVIFYV